MTQLPPVASTALPNIPSPEKRPSRSVTQYTVEVVTAQLYSLSGSRLQAQRYPPLHQHDDVMTCLGSCFIYGAWTLFTKKGRRLDTEIKRTQNAPFHIPKTATNVK